MFERFTAKARHSIVLAQEEARMMDHNYIGTEHVLLGLVHESQGLAARVLAQFGITLDGAREDVAAIVGPGHQPRSPGHIPFTPRAKKTLELALREALALHHNYIGTEHILLGLIREGDGVAAQVMRQHADLLKIRVAVLDLLPPGTASQESRGRNWLRRVASAVGSLGEQGEQGGGTPGEEATAQSVLNATPAADNTLSTAAKLAGAEPVGSHHLLLAALTDADSAAARILVSLGIDINQAKDALRDADVTGTSDEQPEDAGRRQMTLQVTDELLTIVAADATLVAAADAALKALGAGKAPGGTIRGADLQGAAAANLAKAWQALHDALSAIATRAGAEGAASASAGAGAGGSGEATAAAQAEEPGPGTPQAPAS